ncbi:MAG: sensor histidine kinase [Thermoleophilia bacterium]|nr:sensor histidine kinase [Thermoleophilia bacterium]
MSRPTLEDLTVGPISGTVDRLSIVAPFAIGSAIPYAFALVPPYNFDVTLMLAALALQVLVGACFVMCVRRRAGATFFSLAALAYLPVIVLVREANGGSDSGLSPLVVLPLLAIALYGTRQMLYVCVVGVGLVLAAPIVWIGGSHYPAQSEWHRTIIWIIIALIMGPTIQGLVRRTRESEMEFRSVFENVREVIFHTDDEGRWTLLNPAWEEMTGYAVEASLGRPFVDYVHPEDRDGNHELFVQLRDREIDRYRFEMRYQVASGDYRWFEVAARRTVSVDGDQSGVAGTLTDITDRYEAERLKEQFFALVSHELRTPLSAIIGYLELLDEEERDRLSPDGREFITVMQRNSQRLMRLIGDLLFAAQVEAGTLALIRAEVDLGQVARHAVDSARPRAVDRRLELALEVPEEPVLLDADAQRLGQVLDNLLTNAIKFTPAGGRIDVRVTCEGEPGADGALAVLEVADTGEGIAEEDQERLFERFARARTADTNAVQGVGLGLAITRAIVDGHGGRIGLDSALGRGTTVRVELPYVLHEARTTGAAHA